MGVINVWFGVVKEYEHKAEVMRIQFIIIKICLQNIITQCKILHVP